MEEKIYYVYAYYFKSSGEIFHIGKGKGNRYLETTRSRNDYFINIINKYPDDIAVKKLYEGLTNEEACSLERELIKKYKELGQCKTNFHEGGQGGNTGKYDDPERSRKLSESAKLRVGEKNPNFGHYWTEEQKQAASEKSKAYWTEEKRQEKSEWNKNYWTEEKRQEMSDKKKGQMPHNKGVPMTEAQYEAMMDRVCPYLYQIYLNEELLFENISSTKIEQFCKEQFNISRTIVEKVIKKQWKPTFNKHKFLETLRIERIDRKCID